MKFSVKGAAQLFGNPITLIPLNEDELKQINETVNKAVVELGQTLNKKTQPDAYTPHITLSLDGNNSQYLSGVNVAIDNLKKSHNGELFFKLDKFSYTVIK